MDSKNSLLGLENNAKNNGQSQSSSKQTQDQDSTMSLVYPDGRVTNVKVRQK